MKFLHVINLFHMIKTNELIIEGISVFDSIRFSKFLLRCVVFSRFKLCFCLSLICLLFVLLGIIILIAIVFSSRRSQSIIDNCFSVSSSNHFRRNRINSNDFDDDGDNNNNKFCIEIELDNKW